MIIPMPEMPPEMQQKVQKEYDNLAAEFRKWVTADHFLVPPAIATLAEAIYDGSIRAIDAYEEAGDYTQMEAEPITAISSTLAFGMYLGMLGYSSEKFTIPVQTQLTDEDERRLLGESDGATDTGV